MCATSCIHKPVVTELLVELGGTLCFEIDKIRRIGLAYSLAWIGMTGTCTLLDFIPLLKPCFFTLKTECFCLVLGFGVGKRFILGIYTGFAQAWHL
jgi:hypothetical protein